MKKDDLKQGTAYALRPKGSGRGDPFVKVTFVGPARGRQGRIRYEEGELEGLEDWIPTRQLACNWVERNALLRDEERFARLAASDEDVWDRVTEDAISAVMTASGEYGGFVGHWDTDEASAERFLGKVQARRREAIRRRSGQLPRPRRHLAFVLPNGAQSGPGVRCSRA